MEKGFIIGFNGSWSSGLATIIIKDSDGVIQNIHCDNAPTVRALDGCFGNVIASGHCVDITPALNKEIYFSVDSIGILEGFTPVEEAGQELIEEFEKEVK